MYARLQIFIQLSPTAKVYIITSRRVYTVHRLHCLVVSDCHVAQSYSLYQKPPLLSENISIVDKEAWIAQII